MNNICHFHRSPTIDLVMHPSLVVVKLDMQTLSELMPIFYHRGEDGWPCNVYSYIGITVMVFGKASLFASLTFHMKFKIFEMSEGWGLRFQFPTLRYSVNDQVYTASIYWCIRLDYSYGVWKTFLEGSHLQYLMIRKQ